MAQKLNICDARSVSRFLFLQMALFPSLWMDLYSVVHIHHIFFIRSSINRHLGGFHVLAIVNSTALNIGVHVSLWIIILSRYMPGSGVAGSCGNSVFSFWGTSILFSIVAASFDNYWTFTEGHTPFCKIRVHHWTKPRFLVSWYFSYRGQ